MSVPRTSNQPSLIMLIFCVVIILCANRTLNAQAPWTLVGVHPQASQESATNGANRLVALYPWQGRLFAGYGSPDDPTDRPRNGKVAITPFDPVTNTFAGTPAFISDTEAIWIYREFQGQLYAPSVDPWSGVLVKQNFAESIDAIGNQWQDYSKVYMLHVWDMATFNGTDLWFFGSTNLPCPTGTCPQAVAYRRTSGTKFFEAIRIPPVTPGLTCSEIRLAGAYNGKLYVQALDRCGGQQHQPYSWVFNGTTWSHGPDLLAFTALAGGGSRATVFDGKMIYAGFSAAADVGGDLFTLNSNDQVQLVAIPSGTRSFTISGNYLYVLANDGTVRRTTSLAFPWSEWQLLATFPGSSGNTFGMSIAVLNRVVYVGTKNSELFRLELDDIPPGEPPPTCCD